MDHTNIRNNNFLATSDRAPYFRILSGDLHAVLQLCTLRKPKSLSVPFMRNLQSRISGRVVVARDGIVSTVIMVQMRSGHYKPMGRLGTGVFMFLVAHGLCAPVSAWAGCNHLVTSRTDPARLPALIDPLMGDFAGQSEPHQAPQRPCTGAWCSGQPATPAVPAGVFDWGMESWVWWAPLAGSVTTTRSLTSFASVVLHPAHCGSAVFHPPRLLPSA
jgi:hypothetical protein